MSRLIRSAGILMHPTSLPGKFGVGSLGAEAHTFINAIKEAGFKHWQILPMTPVAYGNSPYSSYSAFAGNPLLISVESLLAEGWLTQRDITPFNDPNPSCADHEAARAWKIPTLLACYRRFLREAEEAPKKWFADFCKAKKDWLDEYALFMALKEDHNNDPWNKWPHALRIRDIKALDAARSDLADEIRFHQFLQFLFFRQWDGIRNHCREAGIQLIGDVPIFVALDSADVWTHQMLFYLNPDATPTVVAGVPPDYFCETGQLWGNPLYRWEVHAKTGFQWWLDRLAACFEQVDIVRIDHFRGLESYWEVDASETTAINGRWVKGPGKAFFEAVAARFGELPIIAEDLGTITPEVHELRHAFHLPGMRVLQFGFSGENPKTAHHTPHTFEPNSVCYTGTHDNDTTVGWFYGHDTCADTRSEEQKENERRNFLDYVDATDDRGIHWKMIRLCFSTVSDLAVIPVQDILGLDSKARMNRPGYLREDNWSWRMTAEELKSLTEIRTRDTLRILIWRYGRM